MPHRPSTTSNRANSHHRGLSRCSSALSLIAAASVSGVLNAQTYYSQGLHSGRSVTAGDLNYDGFEDMIVGDPATNQVYIYNGNTGGLMTTIASPDGNVGFGFSVASGIDVTGDGIDDVVVGAPYWPGNAGRAYVYSGFGLYGGYPTIPPLFWSIPSPEPLCQFGFSVAVTGDRDGDECGEILIGAPNANLGQGVDAGIVFNYNARTQYLIEVNFSPGPGARFGYCVAGIGDFTGDGVEDFAISAPYASISGAQSGTVWIRNGGASGLVTQFNGETAGDHFGLSVKGAGDVNGDGRTEVIIGAPDYQSGKGKAYVRSNSVNTLFQQIGGNGWKFGSAVGGVGDMTGDGIADFGVVYFDKTVQLFAGSKTGSPSYWGDLSPYGVSSGNHVLEIAPCDRDRNGINEVLMSNTSTSFPANVVWLRYPTSPTTIANFIASDSDGDAVTLSWTPSTNCKNYVLVRDGVMIAELEGPAISTFRDIPPAGTYMYGIFATNGIGAGVPALNSGTRTSAQVLTKTLDVSAKCNVWGAGSVQVPASDWWKGRHPVGIALPFPNATISIDSANVPSCFAFAPYVPSTWSCSADGTAIASTALNPVGSLSGARHPFAFLVYGVFVNDAAPSGAAPATIDFTTIAPSFTDLSPALNQLFAIGDGRSSLGARQYFHAPAGATRLFLGFADGNGLASQGVSGSYHDNRGRAAMSVRFDFPPPTNYGLGKLNSQLKRAYLTYAGSTSTTVNNFQVHINDAVSNVQGLLAWSNSAANTPFLGGTMLLGAPHTRMPIVTFSSGGFASYSIPLHPVMAGWTRYYQSFYRDPQHPDGTGWGMSNGLSVTFAP
ncbi:MAG: FG-GAP repeat protein [Planctomycetes bacterium]|nr:FG-GAP repeat protein [Planctomycetota bacterium]